MPQARIEEGVWVTTKCKNKRRGIVSRRDGPIVYVTWQGEKEAVAIQNTKLNIDRDAKQTFIAQKSTPIKDAAKRASKAVGSTLRSLAAAKKKKVHFDNTRLEDRFESALSLHPSNDSGDVGEEVSHQSDGFIPRGLKNKGNDCYVISSLQLLFSIPGFIAALTDFIDMVDANDLLGPPPELLVVRALLHTHAQITCSTVEDVYVDELKEAVAAQNTDFGGSDQQDAAIFLMNTVERIHSELSSAKESALSHDIVLPALPTDTFFGIEVNRTQKCIEESCGGVFSSQGSNEQCLHLAVPLGRGPFTLNDVVSSRNETDSNCIDESEDGSPCGAPLYAETEVLNVTGSTVLVPLNRVHFEQCGRKRFKAVKAAGSINAEAGIAFGPPGSPTYRLIGIIVHKGDAVGGHYVAYRQGDDGTGMYCCDDSTITRVSESDLFQHPKDVTVLVYHQSSASPVQPSPSPKTTKDASSASRPRQSSKQTPGDGGRDSKRPQRSTSKKPVYVADSTSDLDGSDLDGYDSCGSSEECDPTQLAAKSKPRRKGPSAKPPSRSKSSRKAPRSPSASSLLSSDHGHEGEESSFYLSDRASSSEDDDLDTPVRDDAKSRRKKTKKKKQAKYPQSDASSSSDIRDGDFVDNDGGIGHNNASDSFDGELSSSDDDDDDAEDRKYNFDPSELDICEEEDDRPEGELLSAVELRALYEERDDRMKHRQKATEKRKVELLRESWAITKTIEPQREISPGVVVFTSKKDKGGARRKATVLEKVEVDDDGRPLMTKTGKPTYKWRVRMNDDKVVAVFSYNSLKIDDEAFPKPREFIWRMVDRHTASHRSFEKEYKNLGLYGLDFGRFEVPPDSKEYDHPYADLLVELWPGDPEKQRQKLNEAIAKDCGDDHAKATKNRVTKQEWWSFIGILIFASVREIGGEELIWPSKKSPIPSLHDDKYNSVPDGVMKKYRFKYIKRMFPKAFEGDNVNDPWNPILSLIDGYNQNRKAKLMASNLKILDESMSPWQPRTTESGCKNGGMPHLSYIFRKPKPLGLEGKIIACSKTGCILGIEIQRGADVMSNKKYHDELGATAACVQRLSIMTRYSGRQEKSRRIAKENKKTEHVHGDSWFSSVVAAEALSKRNIEYFGPVKTNYAGTPLKECQEEMAKWAPGSEVVFECTTDEGVDLFFIGHKYSMRSGPMGFIGTADAGSTTPGRPYDAKWPDSNGAIHSRNIPRPQIISDYFQTANVIDVHNQARQDVLGLEANWRTVDWTFRVSCTIIGMNITDAWKLLRYHCQDVPAFAGIPMKKFAEAVVHDLWFGMGKKQKSMFSPFRDRIGHKFGKKNDVDADDDDDDEGIAFENEQVLIIHKSLQAKVEKAHQIRITDQKSGKKTVTTAKRKCSICHGRAGLDSDAPAKKTDRECCHPHCRARIAKSNKNITHGTFICKICEHKHHSEMARLGIVEDKVYPEHYPDQNLEEE